MNILTLGTFEVEKAITMSVIFALGICALLIVPVLKIAMSAIDTQGCELDNTTCTGIYVVRDS